MDLLFKTDNQFYIDVVKKGAPEFGFSLDYFKGYFNYLVAGQIISLKSIRYHTNLYKRFLF
ncbi:MAG: hypothetical protein IPJ32_07090 [Sphingobacteriaceae bacterium]|nr:hypothetical protein [Sphingobacteriaceae bacterium]